jgi:hypothetical protein
MAYATIINLLLKFTLVASLFTGVYFWGYTDSTIASTEKHNKALVIATENYNKALIVATEENREISRQLEVKTQQHTAKLKELNRESQTKINALKRSVAAGTVRLSIPTITSSTSTSSPTTCEATEPTVRVVTETRTELDPETAQALISITERGDQAIRQLNELIDFYNSIKD